MTNSSTSTSHPNQTSSARQTSYLDNIQLTRPYLGIDVAAIVKNFQILQQMAAPAICACVVKADAYALGVDKIAPVLYQNGARDFFVATISEAVALRDLLPNDARIANFNGLMTAYDARAAALADITPVLSDMSMLQLWQNQARVDGQTYKAILHIDTGLNRLSMAAADFQALDFVQLKHDGVDIIHVMSHLACAADMAHVMNAQQLARFQSLTQDLPRTIARSLAASDGTFLGKDYHFDMVRCGYGLYGGNPQPKRDNPLHHVVTLQLPIIHTQTVTETGTVGYGATASVKPGQKLATLHAGYADGVHRALSNMGHVYIAGHKCPIIGRVSMDLTVIDITACPQPPQIGDFTEILGAHQTTDQLAPHADTIGIELLTLLGQRCERGYETLR